MKNTVILLFLFPIIFCFCTMATAQGKADKIKYVTNFHLDVDELNEEMEIDSDSSDSLNLEEIKFRDMLVKAAEKLSSLESIYIFDKDKIYYQRNMNKLSEDEFILIDRSSLLWSHYYSDKNGNKKYRETQYQASEDWILEYKIQIDHSDKKVILGYECYKIIITENKSSKEDGWRDEYIYELYVTGELDLPFYSVELVWEKIVDKTPLEIKYYKKDAPNSPQVTTAVSIERNMSAKLMKLPKAFKNAVIAN